MSPSLLLEREKPVLRPQTKERAAAIKSGVKPLPVVDERTGIAFRCRCANPQGRHDEHCIYNLV